MSLWSPPRRRPDTSIASGPVRILDAEGRVVRIIADPPDPATIPCQRHGVVWCRTCRITEAIGRRPRGPTEYEPLMDGIDAYGDRRRGRVRHNDDGRVPEGDE